MRTRSIAALGLAAVFAIGCSDGLTTEPVETDVASVGGIALSSHGNNGAIRWIPDSECGVFDGNGDLIFPVDCVNQISTFSRNGNALVVVHASGVANPTGKTVHWDAWNPPQQLLDLFGLEEPPAPCVLFNTDMELALYTLHWKGTVTPSGEAHFVCQYQKKWEFTFPD